MKYLLNKTSHNIKCHSGKAYKNIPALDYALQVLIARKDSNSDIIDLLIKSGAIITPPIIKKMASSKFNAEDVLTILDQFIEQNSLDEKQQEDSIVHTIADQVIPAYVENFHDSLPILEYFLANEVDFTQFEDLEIRALSSRDDPELLAWISESIGSSSNIAISELVKTAVLNGRPLSLAYILDTAVEFIVSGNGEENGASKYNPVVENILNKAINDGERSLKRSVSVVVNNDEELEIERRRAGIWECVEILKMKLV